MRTRYLSSSRRSLPECPDPPEVRPWSRPSLTSGRCSRPPRPDVSQSLWRCCGHSTARCTSSISGRPLERPFTLLVPPSTRAWFVSWKSSGTGCFDVSRRSPSQGLLGRAAVAAAAASAPVNPLPCRLATSIFQRGPWWRRCTARPRCRPSPTSGSGRRCTWRGSWSWRNSVSKSSPACSWRGCTRLRCGRLRSRCRCSSSRARSESLRRCRRRKSACRCPCTSTTSPRRRAYRS
mmetsp:Transcript_52702/g.133815  ORF Transcript_52702/g.133815 Transcript_52702/m.133815 type:complete len:235 (-) Transcript_52702:537-1241(-)